MKQLKSLTLKDRVEVVKEQYKNGKFNWYEQQVLLKLLYASRLQPQQRNIQ